MIRSITVENTEIFPAEWMITYFCKPKLKVGTEWVQKGSTCQVHLINIGTFYKK